MAAAPKLMTVAEYFRTPETVQPMELAFGVLRVAEAPTPRHQSAVASLFRALDVHARARKIGQVWLSPLDVVLDEEHALIVQPDLMFISSERGWIVQDRVRGAPDLVIEVLSPNPRIGKTEERLGWFATYGVRECWLLDQERREVIVLGFESGSVARRRVFERRQAIESSVMPEFMQSLDNILND